MTARSVVLGADVWAVLTQAAAGLTFPAPFSPAAAPAMTAEQAAAAEAALRGSALTEGDDADLLAALSPAVRTALLTFIAPQATIHIQAGLGRDLTAAFHAISDDLATSVVRSLHTAPDDQIAYGPVTFGVRPVGELIGSIVADLGLTEGPADGEPVEIDPAAALAITRALQDDRDDLAAVVAEGEVPRALRLATMQLEQVARLTVAGDGGATVLYVVQAGGRWWTATIGDGLLELAPASAGSLRADLAMLAGVRLRAAEATP